MKEEERAVGGGPTKESVQNEFGEPLHRGNSNKSEPGDASWFNDIPNRYEIRVKGWGEPKALRPIDNQPQPSTPRTFFQIEFSAPTFTFSDVLFC